MALALYRKYRPGTFAEVQGQEHVTVPLQRALRSGRVHHAYLFSGPRGCGKTSSARILARSLNCEKGPTPEPCGECESCVALAPTGPGSLDVIEIDAASHGGVDDARDLRERAFFAPVAARYKVYIIDEAHMVTREGFNALLRVVEEPPPHLKFVFATTEPEKVIGTIRSRTHHYPFRLVPPGVLRDLLADVCEREGIEVDAAVLPLVVRAASGSVRDALSVIEQLIAGSSGGTVAYDQAVGLLGFTDAALLDEVVDALAAGDGAVVFEAVNRVIEGGHDPRRFATDLLERFRDLVIMRAVPDAGDKGLLDHPPDLLERMRGQATRMGPAELSRTADLLHEGLTDMRGATSPRLLLELICARVLLPAASHDEAGLLTRLERLERRLSIEGRGEASGVRHEARRTEHEPPTPERRPTPPVATDRGAGTPGHPPARAVDPPPGSHGQDASSGPGAPVDTPPAEPTDVPALDAAAVRRAWADILEAVKRRRKVSWMTLLGDIHVVAVEGDTLVLSFGKEGDRRGFTTNGSDAVLREALRETLGVDWTISAVGRDSRPSSDSRRSPGGTEREGFAPGDGPDDVSVADPELTGMALIERELGGRVIDDRQGEV
ncbi:MAG: DNA polymerase III subunit gamma and tau [Streptosporangiaceae bacterium]